MAIAAAAAVECSSATAEREGECERKDGSERSAAKSERRVTYLADATFDRVIYSASRNAETLAPEWVAIDAATHTEAFCAKEKGTRIGDELIAVSDLKSYRLSVRFRVVEPESEGYFFIQCFDESQTEISGWDVRRFGNPATVLSISEDYKTIVCDRPLEAWHSKGDGAHMRSLGFYTDGVESTKLRPDLYVRTYTKWGNVSPVDGSYSHVDSSRIHVTAKGAAFLRRAMEKDASKGRSRIRMGVSVVRNHRCTNPWMYPLIKVLRRDLRSGCHWKKAAVSICTRKSIDFTTLASDLDTGILFRPGTRFVTVGYSHRRGTVHFDKLAFEIED